MYCHACGIALTQPTKYCNRCGAQLAPTALARKEKTAEEKRLDEYLDGLFWISVFGLGFIIGGAILLKKVNFSDLVILVYAVLSSTGFLFNRICPGLHYRLRDFVKEVQNNRTGNKILRITDLERVYE